MQVGFNKLLVLSAFLYPMIVSCGQNVQDPKNNRESGTQIKPPATGLAQGGEKTENNSANKTNSKTNSGSQSQTSGNIHKYGQSTISTSVSGPRAITAEQDQPGYWSSPYNNVGSIVSSIGEVTKDLRRKRSYRNEQNNFPDYTGVFSSKSPEYNPSSMETSYWYNPTIANDLKLPDNYYSKYSPEIDTSYWDNPTIATESFTNPSFGTFNSTNSFSSGTTNVGTSGTTGSRPCQAPSRAPILGC